MQMVRELMSHVYHSHLFVRGQTQQALLQAQQAPFSSTPSLKAVGLASFLVQASPCFLH